MGVKVSALYPPRYRTWSSHIPLVLALILVALSRLIWIGRAPLLPDEAYYWDWSRRLSPGYFDHPPLVALVIRVTTALGGTHEWSVRIGMVILGVGTVALAYRSAVLLGGRLAGWLALLATATCPLFVLLSGFAAPDGPLLFLWAATVYALLQALRSRKGYYWYVAGVLLGLALLSKYVAVLLVPSVLLVLIFSRTGWLRRREPYLAAGIALLIFSPNLWWNADRGWLSMVFQLAHGACQSGHTAISQAHAIAVYIATQIAIVGPLTALLLCAGVIFVCRQAIVRRRDSALLLVSCTLVISLLFLLIHGLAHWAAPAYFSASICAAVFLARLLRRAGWLNGIRPVLLCAPIFLSAAVESALIVYTATSGTALPGVLGQMITPVLVDPDAGWRETGRTVGTVLAQLEPRERRRAVLLADSYGTAAEIAFYTPGHPFVYSESNQYSVWGPPSAPRGPLVFVGSTGAPSVALPMLPHGSSTAATLTTWVHGRLVRRLRVVVLRPMAPLSAATVSNLLVQAWHAAATQCENSIPDQ